MSDSQEPKLVLMTGARFRLTIYCAERSTPSLAVVEAVTTRVTAALGATAPDHDTSSTASSSSSDEKIPGFGPLTSTVGLFKGRPDMLRKVCTSETLILHRATMAMLWPEPSTPPAYSGATS